MGFIQDLREEFRVKKFGLSHSSNQCFFRCQWPFPKCIFLLYRIIVACYAFFWFVFVVSRSSRTTGRHFTLVYLTIWTYILLVVHLMLAAAITVANYGQSSSNLPRKNMKKTGTELQTNEKPPPNLVLGTINSSFSVNSNLVKSNETVANGASSSAAIYDPHGATTDVSLVDFTGTGCHVDRVKWYSKMSWVLMNINQVAAPIITALYYAMLYPLKQDNSKNTDTIEFLVDIQLHAVNTCLVVLELCLAAYPVRILHFTHALIYGLVYLAWSAIYWSFDHQKNVLYPGVLDWNNPTRTSVVVALVIVAMTTFHVILWLLSRIKISLYGRCCMENSANSL
ncbi:uncharacterized protein LOC106178276 [Lingula anatina]|uniref:Uncharacterized protein LOC106178276 n=1 Tax=Lingula anatina TaxID=7574 RepID=A0A1S3K2V3_LINAN|nr:uncharacterized protein LOC106178276 [Lingula anatina]|eukprot:XP_013416852.1 uncharacterized protein LOC106178276 [Lingula anatina]